MSETKSNNGVLSLDELSSNVKELSVDGKFILAMNQTTVHGVKEAVLSRQAIVANDNVYSHKIPKEEPVTYQKSSGRCWLFAATNVIRVKMIEKYKLSKFEFSQAHLLFYDKLEKANYFLNNIIKTRNEPTGERLVQYLLQAPVQDGGQFDMFRNIVNKHGLLPKSAYPESKVSGCTRPLKVNYS